MHHAREVLTPDALAMLQTIAQQRQLCGRGARSSA